MTCLESNIFLSESRFPIFLTIQLLTILKWEADAVALDIANGRTENGIMPVEESLRIMKLMDGIRRQGGLVYPQDD